MNKKNIIVLAGLLLIVIIGFFFLNSQDDTVAIDKDSVNNLPTTNGKLKAIDCMPDQRNVDACIEIYQPVCGQMQVECITMPCEPVKQTFENSCKACMNDRVLSYTEGECQDQEAIRK